METKPRKKHRGFVMTGGGAKGLYEAGVIHAFHLTGMEFDIITGSSIGAMNSVFFAEYLFCKRQLPEEVLRDPLATIEQMDGLVKAFQHAWLTMPDKQIIDDGPESALARLKDDLEHFNLTMSQLTSILWWLTDPDKKALPPPRVWPHLLHLGSELVERLGTAEVLRLLKHHRKDWLREALRAYFARFGLETSLVPDKEEYKIKDVFTSETSPLRAEHLSADPGFVDEKDTPLYRLVDPARTLRDYAEEGIHVRLTRANFRTGRLEISSYVTLQEFAAFLNKHAWRIDAFGPEKIPLGSFRLKVPGNPLALNAAICSGRFPGVFRPYRLEDIYPESDDDNRMLYRFTGGWLADPEVEAALGPLLTREAKRKWENWKKSGSMRAFFPRAMDSYVDGGAIDNTPYTAAVDFVRDALQVSGGATRDEMLELFIVYLSTEPNVGYDEQSDPLIYEVVGRTLGLVNAASEKGSANTFETINSFGKRAEQIAGALDLVLESYKETLQDLEEGKRSQVEANVLARAQERWKRDFSHETPDGILDKISKWTEESWTNRLPLQVETVKIYPEAMPLNTLQFTARLGYKKENAVQMLAMGCASTLDSLRARLEDRAKSEGWEALDAHDQRALWLARKWTGTSWQAPASSGAQEAARTVWQCQRTACALHARVCPHGASAAFSTQ